MRLWYSFKNSKTYQMVNFRQYARKILIIPYGIRMITFPKRKKKRRKEREAQSKRWWRVSREEWGVSQPHIIQGDNVVRMLLSFNNWNCRDLFCTKSLPSQLPTGLPTILFSLFWLNLTLTCLNVVWLIQYIAGTLFWIWYLRNYFEFEIHYFEFVMSNNFEFDLNHIIWIDMTN